MIVEAVEAVKAVRRARPAKQQREKDQRSWIDITLEHGVGNLEMAMSLVASTRGLVLIP